MNIERREAARLAALKSLQAHGSLAEVIADAVEAALSWQPAAPDLEVDFLKMASIPNRWGCGCDTSECGVRTDQWQDAGTDPHTIVSVTCINHCLVGRSHPGRVRDGQSRLKAQAMMELDRAHQEQCR